jgi:hypothetical protein
VKNPVSPDFPREAGRAKEEVKMNFNTNPGIYLTEEEKNTVTEMSDKELCKMIEDSQVWEDDLNAEVCERAGLLSKYLEADAEHFEEVVYMAIDILMEDKNV